MPSSKPPPRAKAPESTSTSSKTVSPPEFLVVAQVLAAHGIRGELKCRVITDFPKRRFKAGSSVILRGERHVIESARVQGPTVLLKLADIADRNTAETYRGADVEVATHDAVRLPRGQFYWHQVIGLRVEHAVTHEPLGQVSDIIETGANDVYVVKGERGEILVPAIKQVVKQIDPSAGRMLIEPLPGMLSSG